MVGEGLGQVEWEVIALEDARSRMEDGKSGGKDFDHVCNP